MTREEANMIIYAIPSKIWDQLSCSEINAIELATKALESCKIGHWVNLKDKYEDIIESGCSECDYNGNYKFRYCPNCGAKMEVEEA